MSFIKALVGVILGLVLFVWGIGAVVRAGWFDSAPPPKAEPAPTTAEDLAYTAIEIAKLQIPQTLRDPSSARFRNIVAVKTPGGSIKVCGEVNAKNGFGGYTGFSLFMYEPKRIKIEQESGSNAFRKEWNATCAKWTTLARANS